MNYSHYWCILWNPIQRYLHRERLDRYLESNRQDFLDSNDQQRVEVLLELSSSEEEIDQKLKEWSAIQNDPPPPQAVN
jgi:hypothetical protein